MYAVEAVKRTLFFKRHVLFKFIGTCRRELVFLWGQRRAPVWNVCRAFYFVIGIRGLIGVYWADVKICFRTALETYLGDAADLRAEVLILIKGSRGVSLLRGAAVDIRGSAHCRAILHCGNAVVGADCGVKVPRG